MEGAGACGASAGACSRWFTILTSCLPAPHLYCLPYPPAMPSDRTPALPRHPPPAQAMSDQQKAELKSRLKDVMSRLMQRDQAAGAMQELYVLRK